MEIRYSQSYDGQKVIRIMDNQRRHYMLFSPLTGQEIARGTDCCSAPTPEEVTEWQARAKELAAQWNGHTADLEKVLYIRYGNLPPNGRSRNHASGELEAGISVYPAKYDVVSGAIVFDDDYGVWQGGTLIGVMSRVPYLVEGEYVGDGSDGEPLLQNVRKVALLSYQNQGFSIKRKVKQA